MAAGTVSPIFDTEQENIKSQLAYANALRQKGLDTKGQMVGNIYVAPNPWANFLNAAAGSGIESYQRQNQGALERSQEQAHSDFISRMPTGIETAPQAGPVQEGEAPLPDVERQMSPRALAQATRQWAASAPRGMEGVQGFALQQAMTAPEREAAAAERAAEARLKQEAVDAEKERNRLWQEQYKTTFPQKLQIAQATGAQNVPVVTVDENGKPTTQFVDRRDASVVGAPLEKPVAGGKAPKGGNPVDNAKEVLEILKQADPLVVGSTASGIGNVADITAGFFGKSLPGATKAAQLRSLGGLLVSKMPRMEGPQSDKDVALYKEMAGRIGDPTVPTDQKQAAIETIREINSRYAGIPYIKGGKAEAPPAAIEKLRANPALAKDFEAKYGYLPQL